MPLFTVKRRGPSSPRAMGGDMYFSKQKCSGGYALAVRLSVEVMDRLRWRANDRVFLEFDKHGETGVWTLCLTDDPDGVTILVKKPGSCGLMKVTIPPEHMKLAIPNGPAGYVASLDAVKGDAATFLVDYAQ